MGDTLSLECTKNIISSQIKNNICLGFQMTRQDLPSRRKEKVTDGTAITECDNYDDHADDVIVPKDNNQKFAQLTSLSVGFLYLLMVVVSSASRLISMQVKSQK